MALQTSPPISLSDILAEFGAPAGTSLTAMVRGGAYVPDIPQNAAVPRVPPIGLLDFLGASNTPPMSVTVTQSGGNVFQPEPAPATMYVEATLQANPVNGSGSYTYQWRTSAGGAVVGTGAMYTVGKEVTKNIPESIPLWVTVSDGITTETLAVAAGLNYTSNQ